VTRFSAADLDAAMEELGLNPADDRAVYAEYVAMLAEDARNQEQAARDQSRTSPVTEASEPPSMESLGLDPSSEFDCEAYAGFLEGEAEAEAAIPLDMELSSAFVVMDTKARPEQRQLAAAYLRVLAQDRAYFRTTTPMIRNTIRPKTGRARRRAAPVRRRVRVRSGSRGDPPRESDDDPDPVRPRRREAVAA